jgi:[acyl-carrier-protein] S-malonyltransferase
MEVTIAFVFPGQGAQQVGMGHDLYDASAAARAVFDQADAVLGFPITRLCFEGPEASLTATENAQPALLTTSAALVATLAEGRGDRSQEIGAKRQEMKDLSSLVSPLLSPVSFVAGHSLGEYSALVAAGALDFATALRLVRRRGELMAAAREGAMAAIIGLDEAPLEAICGEASAPGAPVVIANYNSPGQLVISGASEAVERACDLAKARGAKRALHLKVSAAFHSPLMRAAADKLAGAIAESAVADARVPVIANVTAAPLSAADAIRGELVAQVTAPVRWITSVQRMAADGVDTFVEIGPGSVLTGLIKRIAPSARLINVSDVASLQAFLSL